MWKLEDLFAKFNKKCEKLEILDISAKSKKKEVYLKNCENTKNEKRGSFNDKKKRYNFANKYVVF